jgi:hypothetical protein
MSLNDHRGKGAWGSKRAEGAGEMERARGTERAEGMRGDRVGGIRIEEWHLENLNNGSKKAV